MNRIRRAIGRVLAPIIAQELYVQSSRSRHRHDWRPVLYAETLTTRFICLRCGAYRDEKVVR